MAGVFPAPENRCFIADWMGADHPLSLCFIYTGTVIRIASAGTCGEIHTLASPRA